MPNIVQPHVIQPQQQQQQKKKKGTDLDWLRPIGTAASAMGFPYLSMALGAYDMFNGDPSGLFGMLGGQGGVSQGGDIFSNMLQHNPYGGFGSFSGGGGFDGLFKSGGFNGGTLSGI